MSRVFTTRNWICPRCRRSHPSWSQRCWCPPQDETVPPVPVLGLVPCQACRGADQDHTCLGRWAQPSVTIFHHGEPTA